MVKAWLKHSSGTVNLYDIKLSYMYLLIAKGNTYQPWRKICHTYKGESQMTQLSNVSNGTN